MLARVLVVLVSAGLLTGCGEAGMAPTPHGEVVVESDRRGAPAFAGDLLGGGGFDSTSLAGRVAVVNFWGSWCGPCRGELPDLQALAERSDPHDVAVLGIDLRDQEGQAQAFLADRGVDFPSLFDPHGEVATAFADFPITRTPATVLIDAEGRVAAVYVGATSGEDLSSAVGSLLAEDS